MKPKVKEFLLNVAYVGVCLCMALFIVVFVMQRITVVGSSMYPTLENGDNLFVNKLAYKFSEPERYDVIVFPYRYGKGEHYIKRIIGLPGETVFINNEGTIYINGTELNEDFGYERITDAGAASCEIKLSDDEYFVLGDNRNHSADSRDLSVGNIKFEEITGRASLRIWPLNKIGKIK